MGRNKKKRIYIPTKENQLRLFKDLFKKKKGAEVSLPKKQLGGSFFLKENVAATETQPEVRKLLWRETEVIPPGCNQEIFWAQEVEMSFRNARKKRLGSTQKCVCRKRKDASWTDIARKDLTKIVKSFNFYSWQAPNKFVEITAGWPFLHVLIVIFYSQNICRKIVVSIHFDLSKMKDNKCLKDSSPCQA